MTSATGWWRIWATSRSDAAAQCRTLAVGPTAGDCWVGCTRRSCKQQVMALSAGQDNLLIAPEASQEEVRRGSSAGVGRPSLAWPAVGVSTGKPWLRRAEPPSASRASLEAAWRFCRRPAAHGSGLWRGSAAAQLRLARRRASSSVPISCPQEPAASAGARTALSICGLARVHLAFVFGFLRSRLGPFGRGDRPPDRVRRGDRRDLRRPRLRQPHLRHAVRWRARGDRGPADDLRGGQRPGRRSSARSISWPAR